jgi:hypothetical protein
MSRMRGRGGNSADWRAAVTNHGTRPQPCQAPSTTGPPRNPDARPFRRHEGARIRHGGVPRLDGRGARAGSTGRNRRRTDAAEAVTVDADDDAARLTAAGAGGPHAAARVRADHGCKQAATPVGRCDSGSARVRCPCRRTSPMPSLPPRPNSRAASRMPTIGPLRPPSPWQLPGPRFGHLDPRLASGLRQLPDGPGTARDEAVRWAVGHGQAVEPPAPGVSGLPVLPRTRSGLPPTVRRPRPSRFSVGPETMSSWTLAWQRRPLW